MRAGITMRALSDMERFYDIEIITSMDPEIKNS
jgi:hypothetical protein